MPFILAPFLPVFVACYILAFNLYWFTNAMNIMRHMLGGFVLLRHNMKIDWLYRCKRLTDDPKDYKNELERLYKKTKDKKDFYDFEEIENLNGNYNLIKNWRDVYHVVIITNYREELYITSPTYQALLDSNYPNDRFIVVSAGEKRDEENYSVVKKGLEENFSDKFNSLLFYLHEDKDGEVRGKGSNLYSAGHKLWEYLKKERPEIAPDNILVTTLDADHIVHKEYFSRLTYKYIIDMNRDQKTFQPIPLLFNNIWDAPAANRISAICSSFWQIVEAMRPYRLRTFASHSQSLKTLLVTDFWSNKTIVEDGHQYWRTYFAFNGEHKMVPLLIPVYQDCVLAEDAWTAFKNQYLQRRRWAWGVSDFPYIIKNFIYHPEIPLLEKLLQTNRHFSGTISWSTASFIIAFAWVPLLFNESFQDTVLAQNISYYSSVLLKFVWIGIVANIWVFFTLIPPKPEHHKNTRYLGMLFQWFLSPIVAIFLSSLPALESQTRLMLGKYLDVFWLTPKMRHREEPRPVAEIPK
jgi:hypothetical protein